MNELDEKGYRQGCWELRYDNITWKGIYSNGKKHGIWRRYILDYNNEIVFFHCDKLIYRKSWTKKETFYYNEKVTHIEEYE